MTKGPGCLWFTTTGVGTNIHDNSKDSLDGSNGIGDHSREYTQARQARPRQDRRLLSTMAVHTTRRRSSSRNRDAYTCNEAHTPSCNDSNLRAARHHSWSRPVGFAVEAEAGMPGLHP